MARMKGQMVRFGRRQWALIQSRAEAEGVTTSQFVRDSAQLNAMWSLAREAEARGMPRLSEKLAELDDECARAFEALTGVALPVDDDGEDGDTDVPALSDGHSRDGQAELDGRGDHRRLLG